DTFDAEYDKAACNQDVFILFTSGVSKLPSRSAIDQELWRSYFDPFVGRAFHYADTERLDINNVSFSYLTAITGIGPTYAERIITERNKHKFDDIEDAHH
ncbi:8255_t:CDS:1, partial [Paraglomus occultum]